MKRKDLSEKQSELIVTKKRRSTKKSTKTGGNEETKIMNEIRRALELEGYLVIRMYLGPVVQANWGAKPIFKKNPNKGFPDLFGYLPNGRGFAIEVKTNARSSTTSPEQKEWLKRLSAAGVICIVARSTEFAVQILRDASKKPEKDQK